MPDRSWTTVFIPTPLIFRYHLPLKVFFHSVSGDVRGSDVHGERSLSQRGSRRQQPLTGQFQPLPGEAMIDTTE